MRRSSFAAIPACENIRLLMSPRILKVVSFMTLCIDLISPLTRVRLPMRDISESVTRLRPIDVTTLAVVGMA
jgi:hypothetical protein